MKSNEKLSIDTKLIKSQERDKKSPQNQIRNRE